ncbi:MAG: histidinol dehydrogenase [Alphaproteobacteria bacterium]|nr:histidinol dehydrogenase [Alphaproteobacteria bacterium]
MTMHIIDWAGATAPQRQQALARPAMGRDESVAQAVAAIVADVRARGDDAVRDINARFDPASRENLRVGADEIASAVAGLDAGLRAAIDRARANIAAFHEAQRPQAVRVETMPGVMCEMTWRAMENVGLYVPGGTAPLLSTVLMLAIPARLAGCGRVFLCTPSRGGVIHPAILAAAHLCGVDEIYGVGGAQAVAAMAYGTATIPKADKIFGPGNAYVTTAKQMVAQDAGGAAIDMPAGPSEVMIIAGAGDNPAWVAADMLAQAEHDVVAQAVLVTTDADFARAVEKEITAQLAQLPRREIAAQSLSHARVIIVPDMAAAIDVANAYAPEHLIIHGDDAAACVPHIRHAGSVFVGAWTPESAGDYASGTNHVLPTYGYARAYGGVNLYSFMKSMTVQRITPQGLRNLGPSIMAMAGAEGLDAHARAVSMRLETM